MRRPSNSGTFELNGKGYSSDAETLAILRSAVAHHRANRGDGSAVQAIMSLGLHSGRIVELVA